MGTAIRLLAIVAIVSVLVGIYSTIVRVDNEMLHASFNRIPCAGGIQYLDAIDLRFPNHYIAGITPDSIYLGHPKLPSYLLAFGMTDTMPTAVAIDLPRNGLTHPKYTIESPYFIVVGSIDGIILRGRLHTWEITDTLHASGVTGAIPISNNSLAMVGLHRRNNTFKKLTAVDGGVRLFPDILHGQGEGVFSSSGQLLFEKESPRLIYVHRYRNKILVLDTNFNYLSDYRTIDSISRAKIKVMETRRGYSLASNALVVNKGSAVSDNRLYVHSNIPAANEPSGNKERSVPIDVYDTTTGAYLHSLYLPLPEGQRLTGFGVSNDLLVCIRGHHLVRYRIRACQ